MALGLIQSGFIQQSVICADALNPIMSAREVKRVFMFIFLVQAYWLNIYAKLQNLELMVLIPSSAQNFYLSS